MPGISLHQELEALSRIGLSPRQVLAAATSNFAKVFPNWGAAGEVREGQRAHLVVLGADPRVDVANVKSIEKVILAGEILDPSTLLSARSR
jgi:imidazolonepropionase-like amidohydrolase